MMEVKSTVIKRDEDVQIYHYGIEQCDRGHFFGPAVRDHFLIHFILSGKGSFKVGEKMYRLEKNQAFLIVPDVVTYYEADMEDPWIYCWLGFNGIKAFSILKEADFTIKNPILCYDDNSSLHRDMEQILKMDTNLPGSSLRLKAFLYMILSEIQRINYPKFSKSYSINYKDLYIQKAIDFIEKNYSRHVSVSDIVKYVGLDRSYFSTIFKESMNISPQGYLIDFRMKKAAELLSSTTLTIGDIARSVGYNDPLCFSKVFKKIMGVSPLVYRNSLK